MSESDSSKEQEMQRKSLEFEMLRQQSDAIEKQIEEIEMKRNEMLIVKQSMSELKGQTGKEILVPIGSGVFLKGQLNDDKSILDEVGANVIAEKTINQADELIEQQLEEIEKLQNKMRGELIMCVEQLQRLEPELVKYFSNR
jgi:prefoldin alpha subunit